MEEYILAAPFVGRDQLWRLYNVLKSVAPEAEEAIKWGTPFFIEPRFLFAFSAHKAHCSFAPIAKAMDVFRPEFGNLKATKGLLKIPYTSSFPEKLVRSMAEFCLREVQKRQTNSFW